MQLRRIATLVLLLALSGCTASHGVPIEPLEPGTSTETLIGAAGGTVSVGEMDILIPPGALDADTTVRVVVSSDAIPSTFTGYSPVVHFEPEGLSFAAPIEVRIPFMGDADLATIFWSQHEGDAYVPRPTRIEGGYAVAESTHFSSAFVGTACEGGDCCDPANGELDLLLVVDNSNSMQQEQALLAAEIPRLARILASGDRDGDGVQDFPALSSIHVGIITTDLGAGPVPAGEIVPSCDAGFGDDGVLVSIATSPSCDPSYASSVVRYDEAVPGSLEPFVAQIGCVANVGTSGCGFEQPLEATLIALSPNAATPYTGAGYTTPSFATGRPAHGDTTNAGLVRDASILAILELTDETDTSAEDLTVFQPGATEYAGIPLNLRATAAGGASASALHPVSRYVDGLLALRSSPADLIFGAVAGVPSGMIADPAHVDFDALLASSEMAEVADPSMSPSIRILPVCSGAGGQAYPARRIAETARGIDAAGGGTVMGSICDGSFDLLIDGLIARVAARASGRCE